VKLSSTRFIFAAIVPTIHFAVIEMIMIKRLLSCLKFGAKLSTFLARIRRILDHSLVLFIIGLNGCKKEISH